MAHGSSEEYELNNRTDGDARSHSAAFPRNNSVKAGDKARRNTNARLANPLANFDHPELERMGATFAKKYQLGDESDIRAFRLGAVLAKDPSKFEDCKGLSEDELEILRKEFNHKWSQPKLMYLVIVLCSTCAAVQGMGMLCPLHTEKCDCSLLVQMKLL